MGLGSRVWPIATAVTLGITAAALLSRCEDKLQSSYMASGPGFMYTIKTIDVEQRYHHKVNFQIHTESAERNYPGTGQPLPRIEVKEYQSGKIEADIYLAR